MRPAPWISCCHSGGCASPSHPATKRPHMWSVSGPVRADMPTGRSATRRRVDCAAQTAVSPHAFARKPQRGAAPRPHAFAPRTGGGPGWPTRCTGQHRSVRPGATTIRSVVSCRVDCAPQRTPVPHSFSRKPAPRTCAAAAGTAAAATRCASIRPRGPKMTSEKHGRAMTSSIAKNDSAF